MTTFPAGSDPAALAFLVSVFIAMAVIAPVAWLAIRYDMRLPDGAEWPVWRKRAFIGLVLLGVVFVAGSTLNASMYPDYNWCEQFERWSFEWFFFGCWM